VDDGDGADDGQSEAVVVVRVGAVELEASLPPLQQAAGPGPAVGNLAPELRAARLD
jgi:hypothetical protein